jgi:hypothetical protein
MTPSRSQPRREWLTQHLIGRFPEVPPALVIAAVLEAWAAVELFGLSDNEAEAMAGTIAAQQLAQQAGRSDEEG